MISEEFRPGIWQWWQVSLAIFAVKEKQALLRAEAFGTINMVSQIFLIRL